METKKQKPLSKTQTELLEAMKNGVVCHYQRYMGRFNPNPYYFRNDTRKRCTAAATALRERGLVVMAKQSGFGDHVLAYKQPEDSP